jgi:hypothetical protein
VVARSVGRLTLLLLASRFFYFSCPYLHTQGPIDVLLKYGCTVVAIDIDREPTWNFLLNKVKDSPGRLIMPIRKDKVPDVKSQKDAQTYFESLEFTENPKKKGSFRWVGPIISDLAKVTGCNLLEEVSFDRCL